MPDDHEARIRKLENIVAAHVATCDERAKQAAATLGRIEGSVKNLDASQKVQLQLLNDHLTFHQASKFTTSQIGGIVLGSVAVLGLIWAIVEKFL